MFHQTILVPSVGDHQVPVEAYIPGISKDIEPDIRRPALIVFPGGGYSHLGTREGESVALRFLSLGFNVFVAAYRFDPHRFPVPMQDGAAVIAHVRAHADEYRTDKDRIAILGFSAGGHLAGYIGTCWQQADLWAPLGLTPEQMRPNAMALGYAVLTAGEHANRGSFVHLTGTEDETVHQPLSIENLVTENCPPTFLWSSFDDAVVPVESSLLMALALSRAHVPAELHAFRHGPHGASLYSPLSSGPFRPQMNVPEMTVWPEMAARFFDQVMPTKARPE